MRITLLPLGDVLEAPPGTPLQDLLFTHGVEFPCGGRGRCKGCRVKVLSGSLPITEADRRKLSAEELSQGWRLSCCACAGADVTLELEQWDVAILSDNSAFDFEPQEGWGVAVDLGTTTIVAQLLDLQTGHVLAVRSALNEQAKHGADIMSRVEFAVENDDHSVLQNLVRKQIGELIQELLESAAAVHRSEQRRPLVTIIIVGNTVMHHLFCGISVEPLSHFPFESPSPGLHRFYGAELGWDFPGDPAISFLPCLGGFVGSDILAGILATKLHERSELSALIDLGTNGEIVVGNRQRLLCASTAAGPAFEGARISMGMRAATGAISEVHAQNGTLHCHTVGNVDPRGICGSGLVDAIASALDLGLVLPNGRLASGEDLPLAETVKLTQWDIRELQLAKGAIAAGLRILLKQWGASKDDLSTVYLAGAFGNYINQNSAKRIGLLDLPPDKLKPAGNSALLGAKLALFNIHKHHGSYPEVVSRLKHIPLNEDPEFQDTYVAEMNFPEAQALPRPA